MKRSSPLRYSGSVTSTIGFMSGMAQQNLPLTPISVGPYSPSANVNLAGDHGGAAGDTRVRRKVLAMTVALAAITYLDRVAIGVTRPYIARDLEPDAHADGLCVQRVLSVVRAVRDSRRAGGATRSARAKFSRASSAGGRRSPCSPASRSAIRRCWRSVFCSARAKPARGRTSRARSRAGFPRRDRGTVQGTFFMGAHLAGGLTPLLATALLAYMDWRTLFVVFGSIGFIWALAWYRWFRDTPAEHPAVSAAERTFIEDGIVNDERPLEKTQWKRLLANRTVICLCLMYFTQTFGNAFYVTWLPTYLASRGLSVDDGRHPLGTAADAERRRRSDGRHHDRRGSQAARSPPRPHPRRRRRADGGGPVHDCRRVHRLADRGRRADCARRRVVELPARSGVGHVPRHRRPPRGRVERGDEHVGAGRRDPQPDSHRARRAAICEFRARRCI